MPFPREGRGWLYTESSLADSHMRGILPGEQDCSRQPEGAREISFSKVEGAHGLDAWILIPFFLTSWVTLDTQLNLSEPQFLPLSNNYPWGLSVVLNEIINTVMLYRL